MYSTLPKVVYATFRVRFCSNVSVLPLKNSTNAHFFAPAARFVLKTDVFIKKIMFFEDFLLSLAPQAKFFGACGAPNSRKHYTISALKTNENPQNFRLWRTGHQNPV